MPYSYVVKFLILPFIICACVATKNHSINEINEKSCSNFCFDEYNRGRRDERRLSLELETKIEQLNKQLEECNRR